MSTTIQIRSAAARKGARTRAMLYPPKLTCARCEAPRIGKNYYCRAHHAEYMREWRKTHRLNPDQRRKDNARSYANVYKRRGELIPQPCASCGCDNAEMHHADYSKPLAVEWLCRPCHLQTHYPEPKNTCAKCAGPRDTTGCYCRSCRAAYQREYRELHRKIREVSRETCGIVAGLLCEAT